jgi:DNA mismatch endonuclease (patch repair protein)
MAAVKSKDTTPEMIVRRLLHGLGFRYRLHRRDLPGTPDIVLPGLAKVINVNGCFWHLHGCGGCRIPASRRGYWIAKLRRNRERDAKSRRKLRRLGFAVMTIWECQTRDVEKLSARIIKFLRPLTRKHRICAMKGAFARLRGRNSNNLKNATLSGQKSDVSI